MSPTLHQLTELGRTALQRLQQSGDCAWMLFQAEGALLAHECSSVQNLLHPLSLSQDSNLNRIVAAQAEPNSTVPATTERIGGRSVQSTPPAAPSFSTARPFFQPSAHHIHSLDPVVGSDSPRGRQLVRELVDRASRESFSSEQAQQNRLSPPLGIQELASLEAPQRTSLPQTTISADRDDHATKAIRHKGLSPPFSEIVPESGPRDWFTCHPRHKEAAASVLAPETVVGIDQPALHSWSRVTVAQHGMLTSEPSPLRREAGRPDTPAAASGAPHLMPWQKGPLTGKSGFTGHLSQDATNFQTSLSPSPPAASSPAPSTSQLELLVQKWQESKATAPGDNQRTPSMRIGSHQPEPGPLPSFQSPHHNTHPAGEPYAEPEAGPISGEDGFLTQNGQPSRRFFSASPSSARRASQLEESGAQVRTDLETDRLFAETLARVLNREIRRHGLEEQP